MHLCHLPRSTTLQTRTRHSPTKGRWRRRQEQQGLAATLQERHHASASSTASRVQQLEDQLAKLTMGSLASPQVTAAPSPYANVHTEQEHPSRSSRLALLQPPTTGWTGSPLQVGVLSCLPYVSCLHRLCSFDEGEVLGACKDSCLPGTVAHNQWAWLRPSKRLE